MEVIHLTEHNRDAVIEHTASLLRRGGVVALPTDTAYGLAADVLHESAIRKIFRIKKRSYLKALPVFVRDVEIAGRFAAIDSRLERLLGELWPGQTTAVLRKRAAMPDLVTGGQKTVGLRMPDHPFLSSLLAACPNPLAATPANLSGSEPASSAVEVQIAFRKHIPRPDLVIDGGTLPPPPPSTVLDLTNAKNPKILRMGGITKRKLDEFLNTWQSISP